MHRIPPHSLMWPHRDGGYGYAKQNPPPVGGSRSGEKSDPRRKRDTSFSFELSHYLERKAHAYHTAGCQSVPSRTCNVFRCCRRRQFQKCVCVCVTICRPRKAQRDWIYFTAQSAIVMNPKFWLIGKRNKRIIFLIWKEILIQVLQDAFYGSAVHLGAALVYRSCKNCLAWGVCVDDKRECYFCYVLLITIFMWISGSKGSFD